MSGVVCVSLCAQMCVFVSRVFSLCPCVCVVVCVRFLSFVCVCVCVGLSFATQRSQVGARKHLGLLEKHKDYVKRARNFHRKEESLRQLREKAAMRNPDEFYHKMIGSRTTGGVHLEERDLGKLTAEELKLMNTQDVKYLETRLQMERKVVFAFGGFFCGVLWCPCSSIEGLLDDGVGFLDLGRLSPYHPSPYRKSRNCKNRFPCWGLMLVLLAC